MTVRRRSLIASWALILASADAIAFEAYVDADLTVQLYELSNPWRTTRLERRRFTHTLAVRGMNLTSALDPTAPHLDAIVRARVDADVAAARAQLDPTSRDYVPGFREAPTDLMVAYVEGRRFLNGHVGFRLGRQYVVDSLGWWSFDGARARLETPAHLAVEAYGGAEQRGGPPALSTSRFEADGVLRGDRSGLEANEWPEYLDGDRVAPAFGVAVEASGLSFLQARATYRRVISRDDVVTAPFTDDDGDLFRVSDARVSTERAGMSATITDDDLGSIATSGVYDVYLARPTDHGLDLTWFASPELSLGAGYRHHLPSYDADSIFNWFPRHGTTTVEARSRWIPSRRWELALAGGARRFSADTGEGERNAFNATGSIEAVRRHRGGRVGGRFLWEGPAVARVVGGEIDARQSFDEGRYETRLVASLFDFSDDARLTPGATTTSYVVGAFVRPSRWARTGLEWEHAMSAIVPHRFRVVATLEVEFQ